MDQIQEAKLLELSELLMEPMRSSIYINCYNNPLMHTGVVRDYGQVRINVGRNVIG